MPKKASEIKTHHGGEVTVSYCTMPMCAFFCEDNGRYPIPHAQFSRDVADMLFGRGMRNNQGIGDWLVDGGGAWLTFDNPPLKSVLTLAFGDRHALLIVHGEQVQSYHQGRAVRQDQAFVEQLR